MNQLTLSHNALDGPWQVVIVHPTDPHNWYIYNTKTGRYRKIGRVGARRVNYRLRAEEIARDLNRKETHVQRN
jgi:hypothetical protein